MDLILAVSLDEESLTAIGDMYLTSGEPADRIITNAQLLQLCLSLEGWKYPNEHQEGLLIYDKGGTSTMEDVLNNPNKLINCASYVASILYVSGLLTKEDLVNATNEKKFNPNYPDNLKIVMEQREYETITDIEQLQPGDIIFYNKSNQIAHVDIFCELDQNDNIVLYSGGSNQSIQSVDPIKLEKNEDKWLTSRAYTSWTAYRVVEKI